MIADLHALGLLEADFNAFMKILVGHHIVHQALQSNLILSECSGSVIAHCHAIQVSLSQCLLADVCCQCHHPLAVASSEDAVHCSDQIAHCHIGYLS